MTEGQHPSEHQATQCKLLQGLVSPCTCTLLYCLWHYNWLMTVPWKQRFLISLNDQEWTNQNHKVTSRLLCHIHLHIIILNCLLYCMLLNNLLILFPSTNKTAWRPEYAGYMVEGTSNIFSLKLKLYTDH